MRTTLRGSAKSCRSSRCSTWCSPSGAPNRRNADTTHTRRIVISAAPAYFQSNCGDTNCLDGGHEYTRQVMQPLREGATRFEAEHTCFGNVGNRTCGRILHVLGTARFRAR